MNTGNRPGITGTIKKNSRKRARNPLGLQINPIQVRLRIFNLVKIQQEPIKDKEQEESGRRTSTSSRLNTDIIVSLIKKPGVI
ncbi:MAG: hypothetical protein ACYC9S_10735 [Leptospirales bacterium]